MRRRTFAAVSAAAVVLIALAGYAHAARGRPDLAAAIRARLEQAGLLVFPAGPDFFGDDAPKPQQSFYVYADLGGKPHSFEFGVYVFPTAASAAAARAVYVAQARRFGTAGAYSFVREGRVVYEGATGPTNANPSPKLPTRDFRSLIAVAAGL